MTIVVEANRINLFVVSAETFFQLEAGRQVRSLQHTPQNIIHTLKYHFTFAKTLSNNKTV